ncbi:MAG TPA: GIY-YIG nuclease family protein [Candidatus Eisenbacteria bacterium]|jgi:putative endonuclease|nr:GIY-YIG nuclease family protein [Candidatus Eisenbacteria bacterium]
MIRGLKAARPARGAAAWFVYILRCGDGSLYTGITNNLARRVRLHGSGRGARYTRSRLPVRLVWRERCADRSRALVRECAVKAFGRARKLALIKAKGKR